MERRLSPPDLQRQVESFLVESLGSDSISIQDLAGALRRIALERKDNPVKQLFRNADSNPHVTSSDVPAGDSAGLAGTVRLRNPKLSLRFGRKSDKERPATAASHSGDAASASTQESSTWRKHHLGLFSKPNVAICRPPTSVPTTHYPATNATEPNAAHEYVERLQEHGLWGNDSNVPYGRSHTSAKPEPEAVDEKRGFFTFATSPKRSKSKIKSEAELGVNAEYSCVFCDKSGKKYSSKGTCKRHLEEMHVARKYLQCNGCSHRSNTVPDARKHSAQCSQASTRTLGWTPVKPPAKKIYSSEFRPETFNSPQNYVEHLLDLCALPLDQRPALSVHLKLRNLLSSLADSETLANASREVMGDAHAWRTARWDYETVRGACKQLESGILEQELDPGDLLYMRRQQAFLRELLAEHLPQGAPASRKTSNPDKLEKQPLVQMVEADQKPVVMPTIPSQAVGDQQMKSISNDYSMVASSYFSPQTNPEAPGSMEMSTKRPLSYESSAKVPERHPPGPSPATLQVEDAQHYQQVAQYTGNSSIGTHYTGNSSIGTVSPAFTGSLLPLQEQPPPYEPDFAASRSYPTPQPSLASAQRGLDSLELSAGQYNTDLAQGQTFDPMNLSHADYMTMYDDVAASVPPSSSANAGHIYDAFTGGQSTGYDQNQNEWNSWFAETRDTSAGAGFSGTFNGMH